MASLVERKNRYYVVYTYENEAGEKEQKWENKEKYGKKSGKKGKIRKNKENKGKIREK